MMKLKIVSSLLLTWGLLNLANFSVQAQNANLNNSEDPFQSNEQDPLYGGSGFNPMDLIHNANFFNGRNSAEFAEDSNNHLDNAADNFKKQQLQRLMEMRQQEGNEIIGNPDQE